MWQAAIPVVTGIIGNLASSGDRGAAQNAYNQAVSELMAIGMPPDLSREVVMQQFQSAGVLTPELEQEIKLNESKLAQVQEDPTTREAQMQALQLLQQSGRGITPQDRLKFNEMRDQVQRDNEAKRQQIIQSFRQRGMGGSGAELASQLSQAQSSANQASLEGDRIAASSEQNALDAIARSGTLGGQIRGQDFDVTTTKARAEDELNRFNTQNQINRQTRNVGSTNQSRQYNLGNAQTIMNQNTAMNNAERQRQNEARRTFWQDQMNRAQVRAGGYNQQGAQADARANRTANQWVQGGTAVAGAINAYNSKPMDADTKALTDSDEWNKDLTPEGQWYRSK